MAIQIRYLGWVAFQLVTTSGRRIVLDPLLQGSPQDGIPPSPIKVEELYDTDMVIITHGAGDHVGQAFEILDNSDAILICDVATRHVAQERKLPEDRIYHMLSGVKYTFDGVTVKALPAQHISLVKTDQGFVNGQPLSYIIEVETGERLFFGGDTSIHSDLKLYGELYKPQIAMLGVGGVDVHGQSLTELYPEEAALSAKWLGVTEAIPMHYRLDEGEQFIEELAKVAPETKGVIMKPGDIYTFNNTSTETVRG